MFGMLVEHSLLVIVPAKLAPGLVASFLLLRTGDRRYVPILIRFREYVRASNGSCWLWFKLWFKSLGDG